MNPPVSDPARGEIWRAHFDPIVGREQGGERPCLVLSDDRFNQSRAELTIVLPITRTDRGIASHVRVAPPEGGLKDVSFIKCEDIRSISKQRLKIRWGKVSPQTLAAVEDRMRLLLNL
jgi:mRNA interferase MazF